MGLKITTIDTDGIKNRVLAEGEFGYDGYAAGGDEGRVYIGTNEAGDIALAKKAEIDTLDERVEDLEVYDNTESGLTAETLQGAIDELDAIMDSVGLSRVDKYLAAQQVANMVYTDSKLTKVQYNNATDVECEVLGYTDGKLTTVKHYTDSTLKGTTTLSYTSGKLVSAIFVEA